MKIFSNYKSIDTNSGKELDIYLSVTGIRRYSKDHQRIKDISRMLIIHNVSYNVDTAIVEKGKYIPYLYQIVLNHENL